MARPTLGYDVNLRSKFIPLGSEACWPWLGYKSPNHYSNFVFKVNGKSKSKTAHRAVYERYFGEIAKGLVLDHLCKNIHCVNPFHLEPVTQRENLHRSDNHIGVNARKTHCLNGHEFTPENTYIPPKKPNSRYCKTCANERSKKEK